MPDINCASLESLDSVATCLVSLMDVMIYLLIAFAALYTIWGAVMFIKAEGSERDQWKSVIMYGIIGIAVMVSIWGLVGLLTGTFKFSNTDSIEAPTIDIR